MTTRTMSPTAAAAHAKRAMRQRCKALRTNQRVDPAPIFAGRLITYAEATAKAFPADPSRAYREYVESTFHARYVELARVAPLKAVRS